MEVEENSEKLLNESCLSCVLMSVEQQTMTCILTLATLQAFLCVIMVVLDFLFIIARVGMGVWILCDKAREEDAGETRDTADALCMLNAPGIFPLQLGCNESS